MTRLVRLTPADELRRMQREFDRLFDALAPRRTEEETPETAVWTPRVDLAETDNQYLISMDVPGMTRDGFNLNYHEGVLTVSGDRKQTAAEDGREYVRVERPSGPFYRSFRLPKAVEPTGIEASYTNGVLTIRVPKAEAVKPRRITVH